MLNKKGFVITPLIFIAFMLITVVFAFYISDIDKDFAKGIQISATVEKSILDIYKDQINQINFAKLAAYDCSNSYCYSLSNKSIVESCINTKLDNKFNDSNWNTDINSNAGSHYIQVNLSSFNATNINMSSNRVYEKELLHPAFFNIC